MTFTSSSLNESSMSASKLFAEEPTSFPSPTHPSSAFDNYRSKSRLKFPSFKALKGNRVYTGKKLFYSKLLWD